MVDAASGREVFNTSGYMAGEWIPLAYTGNGASETRAYRIPTMSAVHFERLSGSSNRTGPPPAGTPWSWRQVPRGFMDCTKGKQKGVDCLAPAPGRGCTGQYAGQ